MRKSGGSGVPRTCFAVRFISRISRLLDGIIGLLGSKHKGIGAHGSEKARFVALGSGFTAIKFYIWQMV
jgi:hypothetical protein